MPEYFVASARTMGERQGRANSREHELETMSPVEDDTRDASSRRGEEARMDTALRIWTVHDFHQPDTRGEARKKPFYEIYHGSSRNFLDLVSQILSTFGACESRRRQLRDTVKDAASVRASRLAGGSFVHRVQRARDFAHWLGSIWSIEQSN